MAWIKIDDQFADHPKIVAAGPLASWLYICGLTYCGRYLTDGWIPRGQVRKLADVDNPLELAQRLIEIGLWEVVDGGYQVHDYLEYNPPANKIIAIREARSEAGRRGGMASGESKRKANAIANNTAEEKQNQTPSPSPSPVPFPSSLSKNMGAKASPSSPFKEMSEYWIQLFPEKPKPRYSKSAAGKIKTRMKEQHFRDNWKAAMLRASKSNYVWKKDETWFDFGWLLKNDINYEKALNGKYDVKPGTQRKLIEPGASPVGQQIIDMINQGE